MENCLENNVIWRAGNKVPVVHKSKNRFPDSPRPPTDLMDLFVVLSRQNKTYTYMVEQIVSALQKDQVQRN